MRHDAGTALVLLHGWALDRRAWQPQFGELASRFRLVAIDRRGFGRSTAPPDLATEIHHEERTWRVDGGGLFRAVEPGVHFMLAGRDTIGVSSALAMGASSGTMMNTISKKSRK